MVRRSHVDNKPGFWDLPGGSRETQDGSDKACVIREIEEETGLKGLSFERVGRFKNSNSPKIRTIFTTTVKGKPRIKLSEEHDKHRWYNLNKLPCYKIHPNARTAIEIYRSRKTKLSR